MRNLKKILSLALALVMVFSLMTFASAQDFSDAADIEHNEAVEVLTALEVIDGVGNNTFNPNGKVTRAQMAKMITLISLGNVSVEAFKGTTTDLTDISGHWAEAYIKYCYAQGIISGKGGGRFDPDAYVTTAEAAKMLLVAIGYNSDVQVYEGPQWNINVIRDAQTNDIFEELSLANDLQINRDQAAQMMYNALTTGIIEKTSEVSRVDGSIIDSYKKSKTDTLLGQSFKGQTWIGTFVGNKDTGSASVAGEIQVYGRIEGTDKAKVAAYFPSDFDISYIGEEVKVIFKDGTSGSPNKPDKNDTIYGVYVTGSTTVYRLTKADLQDAEDDATSATNPKIKFGGVKYETLRSVGYYLNYEAKSSVNASTINNDKADDGWRKQSVDSIKFVTDDNGKISTAYVVEYKLGRVNSVTSDKITVSGIGAIEFDDNNIADGLAKDDVVVYTRFYDNDDKDEAYFTVTLAETVEGKLTGYKLDSGKYTNVVVDGTTYKVNGKPAAIGTTTLTDDALTDPKGNDIGNQVRLYLVNGMVGAIKSVEESGGNYALIIDADTSGNIGDGLKPVKLKLLLTDGTTETVTVHKDSTNNDGTAAAVAAKKATKIDDTNKGDLKVGTLIEYTSINNGVVKIKNLAVKGVAADDDFSEGTTDVTSSGNVWDKDNKTLIYGADEATQKAVAASNAILFVCVDDTTNVADKNKADKNDDFYAYSLRGLGNIAGTGSLKVQYYKDEGQIVAAYVMLTSKPKGGTDNTLYGLVTDYKGTEKGSDDTEYDVYTVAVGREDDLTIRVEAENTRTLDKKMFVTFEETSDNTYDSSDIKRIVTNKDETTGDGLTGWKFGAAEKYDEGNRMLTYYTGTSRDSATEPYKGTNKTTVTVDKDVVFVYVNADKTKGVYQYGTVDPFSTVTGYANILFHEDSSNHNVVDVIIVETSGDGNLATYLQKDANKSTVFPSVGTTYTVAAPAAVTGSAGAGSYSATVSKTSGIEKGETVTITVKCDALPTDGTDTVALEGTGVSANTEWTVEKTGTTGTLGIVKITVNGPVTDLTIGVTNSKGGTVTPEEPDPDIEVTNPSQDVAENGEKGGYKVEAVSSTDDTNKVTIKATLTSDGPLAKAQKVTVPYTVSGSAKAATGDGSVELTFPAGSKKGDVQSAEVAVEAGKTLTVKSATVAIVEDQAKVTLTAAVKDGGKLTAGTAGKVAVTLTLSDKTVNAADAEITVEWFSDDKAQTNASKPTGVTAPAKATFAKGVAEVEFSGDTTTTNVTTYFTVTYGTGADAVTSAPVALTINKADAPAPTVTLAAGTKAVEGINAGGVPLKAKDETNEDITLTAFESGSKDAVKITIEGAENVSYGTATVKLAVGTGTADTYNSGDDITLTSLDTTGTKLTLTISYAETNDYAKTDFTYEVTLKTNK